jgi:hypothetical protein
MRWTSVVGSIRLLGSAGFAGIVAACAIGSASPVFPTNVPKERLEIVRRAQVWTTTNVRSMDLKVGPKIQGAFKPGETVTCDYVDEKLDGATPKFSCAISSTDHLKVKYGQDNGEVFGEVAASRLLWALGFPSDAQYPVRVVCRGCSSDPWKDRRAKAGETTFEWATVERKYRGKEIEPGGRHGWAWPELELIDESAGGASPAHRDALKLLAVFLQHTDTKPEQQRIVCSDHPEPKSDRPEPEGNERCQQPIMMINDLGLTFGKANLLNKDSTGSSNLEGWTRVPVWKDQQGCVGMLSKSLTGTLENPRISEAGRKMLADLLSQLSDAQLADLFDVARFSWRTVKGEPVARQATTADWVAAFKAKRDQIASRTCPA